MGVCGVDGVYVCEIDVGTKICPKSRVEQAESTGPDEEQDEGTRGRRGIYTDIYLSMWLLENGSIMVYSLRIETKP